MYREKIIKASIIVGFLVIFLLTVPFFIVDRPQQQEPVGDVLKSNPHIQEVTTVQQSTNSSTPTDEYQKNRQRAMTAYKNQDYAEVIRALLKALNTQNADKQPTYNLDKYYLAITYSKVQEKDTAENIFAGLENVYKNEKKYWLARAQNAFYLPNDDFHQKAQTYVQEAYQLDKKDLDILYFRSRILQDAYNNYKQSYELHDGGKSYEHFKSLLMNAYQEQLKEAQLQHDDIKISEAESAIRSLMSDTIDSHRKVYEDVNSHKNQIKDIQTTQNVSDPTNQQQNTNSIPADVQLIENLPVIK